MQVPKPPLVFAKFQTPPILRSAFNNFVLGACRLVGLDPDQLSLQVLFPEGLPAPMAWSLRPVGSCSFPEGRCAGR